MKITVSPSELKFALHKLNAIPGSKGASPASAGVLIEADEFEGLRFMRFTPEAIMCIQCPAEVESDGSCAVTMEALSGFSAAGGSIVMELEKGKGVPASWKLKLSSGTRRVALPRWTDTEECKDNMSIRDGVTIDLRADDLLRWIKSVEKYQYTGEGRDNLLGVSIRTMEGKLAFMATDGKRLGIAYGPEREESILPATGENGASRGYDGGVTLTKSVQGAFHALLMESKDKAQLTLTERGCLLSVGADWMKFSIPTTYPPDISGHIREKAVSQRKIQREPLIELVRAALPFGLDDTRKLTMEYSKDKVRIIGQSDWTDSIEVKDPHEPISYIFNGQYMIDFLTGAKGDEVTIESVTKFDALFIRQPEYVSMLMLMRI